MKYIYLLSLLFLSSSLFGQFQIKIIVKKENNKLGSAIVFTDANGEIPAAEFNRIRKGIESGGSISIQSDPSAIDVKFKLQKHVGEQDLFLTDQLSLTESVKFKFDKSGNLKVENLTLNQTNPTPVLKSLRILFINSLASNNPFQISLEDITKPYMQNKTDDKAGDDCRKCYDNYKTETKKGIVLLYYDFACKCFKNSEKKLIAISDVKLIWKKEVRLIIENVNRYNYDVSVTGRTVHLESEMPPLFKNFFFGDDSKLLGTMMSAVSLSKNTDSSLKARFGSFKEALGTYNTELNELKANRISAFLSCTKFNCCDDSTFVSKLTALLDNLGALRSEANELQLEIAAGDSKEVIVQNIAAIKTELIECQNQDKNSRKLVKTKEDEKSKLDPVKDSAKIRGLTEEINKAAADICKNKNDIETRLNDENQRLVLIKSIEAFQVSLPSEEDISKLFLFVRSMVKSNGEYIQTPIPIRGNTMEFAIQIKPNDSSLIKKWNITPLYSDSFGIEIPVLWRPFVSFSSGSFITLGRHLQNKTYDWQSLSSGNNTITDSSRVVLTESGYTNLPLGFAALVNIGAKASRMFGVGLSVGVGLTIEKAPRFGYLGGGTLFFGENRQLGLTAGFMAMQVNKLKTTSQAAFDQQVIYRYKAPIDYYKELRTGGFISLTYTLFTETRINRSKSTK